MAHAFHNVIFSAVNRSHSSITDTRESIQCSSPSSPRSEESQEGERTMLNDAMVSEHFSSQSRSFRLECLESKAESNDFRMNEMESELAAARSEEAMECAMWRDRYTQAAEEASAYRKEADFAEARLVSSNFEAEAQAQADQLQVECMRKQVVESQAQEMAEREQLLAEIHQLRHSVSEAESFAAAYQVQVQRASVEAAQSIVGQFSKREAIFNGRSEARKADAMASEAKDALALAEKKALQAKSCMESMKVELESFRQSEEASVKHARDEAQFEAQVARVALKMEYEQNEEWFDSVLALEQQRQRQVPSAIHADERKALIQLLGFECPYENDSSNAGQHLATIEEHPPAESNVNTSAQKAEDADDTDDYLARDAALATDANFQQLRSELLASREVQGELQKEIQALHSAVMTIGSGVATKDARIQELEARIHIMHAELTLKASQQVSQQAKSPQFVSEGSASSLASECASKSIPQVPFDAVSIGSTVTTVSMNSGIRCLSTGSFEGGETALSSSPQKIGTAPSAVKSLKSLGSTAGSEISNLSVTRAADKAKPVKFTPIVSAVPDASDTIAANQGQEKRSSHPETLAIEIAVTNKLREDISLLRQALIDDKSQAQNPLMQTSKLREDISLSRQALNDDRSRAQSPLMQTQAVTNRLPSTVHSRSMSPPNPRAQQDIGAITSCEPASREQQPTSPRDTLVGPRVRATIQNLFVREKSDDGARLASESQNGRNDASGCPPIEFKPSERGSRSLASVAIRSLSPKRLQSAPAQRADPALRTDTSCPLPRKVTPHVREPFLVRSRVDDGTRRAPEIQAGRKKVSDLQQSEIFRSSSPLPVRLQSTPAVVARSQIGRMSHSIARSPTPQGPSSTGVTFTPVLARNNIRTASQQQTGRRESA